MSRERRSESELLLGEWACLGIVAEQPTHGFAVASRLRVDGDIGRIWSLSRPLTDRALDHLVSVGYLETAREEQGVAGGNRTILRITRKGRTELRHWLAAPSLHLRDLRSEFLLKLALADRLGLDTHDLIEEQKTIVTGFVKWLRTQSRASEDLVTTWRLEVAEGARRFLDQLS